MMLPRTMAPMPTPMPAQAPSDNPCDGFVGCALAVGEVDKVGTVLLSVPLQLKLWMTLSRYWATSLEQLKSLFHASMVTEPETRLKAGNRLIPAVLH